MRSDLNDTFLSWLARRRTDRPFFAFLNYFDAHEPFIPPPQFVGRFGLSPTSVRDYQFLLNFEGSDRSAVGRRDITLARDCYDDCIAHLDEQLGVLLEKLQAQGILANTDVIITSDHGEAFGEHGSIGHSFSMYLEEVAVPLVILSPAAPAGRVVENPVSLRDLPATVVDLLGLSATSPFQGRSLAASWKRGAGVDPQGNEPCLFRTGQRDCVSDSVCPGRRTPGVRNVRSG